ncbi:MAG: hypothetical protein E4H08_10085, partial [Candidatus Atribacteria bacterium]
MNDLVFTGTEGNTTECIAVDEDNNGIVGYRLSPKPGHTWDDIPPGYLGVRLEVTDCNAVGTATAIIMESYVIVAMAEAYVDASVPEGGDGSFEHPFRHLEEALHAVWDGTVYLFPGTYTLPTIGREGDNLGRLGRLTTLQSVPGEERAVIRGAPEVSGHGLRFVDLILENFRVELKDNASLEEVACEERYERLQIFSPNGGETYWLGEAATILWAATEGIDNVQLQYLSVSNTWITTSTENDGSFTWRVPDIASDRCFIRISSLDGTITEESDAPFAVSPRTLTLLSPNGGGNCQAGQVVPITWTSPPGSIQIVAIQYSLTGPSDSATWYDITTSTENDGKFPWTIPDVVSTNCYVRIATQDGVVGDRSESAFTITERNDVEFTVESDPRALTLLSPNGGVSLQAGEVVPITWTSPPGTIQIIAIQYSLTGPSDSATWYDITTSTPNDGRFPWTVPDVISTNCYVRITTLDREISDRSDTGFTITEPRSLTLLSPNGGEVLSAGDSVRICWESEGDVGNFVLLQYSVTGISKSETWYDITRLTPNDGSFTWTVPDTGSTNCFIRIWSLDGEITEKNDSAFTIVGAPMVPRTLTLLSPNGGECFEVGDSIPIRWESTGTIDDVLLQYSRTGISSSEPWYDITTSTPNDGSYTWIVPDVGSSNCFIRIWTLDGEIREKTDAEFTVGVPRSLTILSPNGGESFIGGDAVPIRWESTGTIDDVLLQYSLTGISGSEPWYDITTSTPNDGSYTWTIPEVESYNCFIRVWTLDGEVTEKNDVEFSIIPALEPRTLTLLSPNGGEIFESGEEISIRWESTGPIEEIRIEYSLNGPSYWISIAD